MLQSNQLQSAARDPQSAFQEAQAEAQSLGRRAGEVTEAYVKEGAAALEVRAAADHA